MLLNFKPQFAAMVKDGRKKQTIRAKGKRIPRVGQIAYLYTGLRTKHARRLGAPIIKEVHFISIQETVHCGKKIISVASTYQHHLDVIAHEDGFNSTDEFIDFFRQTHGFPFNGYLIKWE